MFEKGDIIDWFGDKLIVLENHGDSGRVAFFPFDPTLGCVNPFYWSFCGDVPKRIGRDLRAVEAIGRSPLQYIESPSQDPDDRSVSLFVAGGIQGTRNWQRDLVGAINRSGLNVAVFNPRRSKRFKKGDEDAYLEQVTWEFNHIRAANIVSFFFATGTPNPTTLFEYGATLDRRDCCQDHMVISPQKVVVGCDFDYEKKRCVKTQTELMDESIEVHVGFAEFTQALLKTIADA